jgi:hypothetical protein
VPVEKRHSLVPGIHACVDVDPFGVALPSRPNDQQHLLVPVTGSTSRFTDDMARPWKALLRYGYNKTMTM